MPWLRVDRRHNCVICDRPDWCLRSSDGTAAICARIESDRRAGDAGWFHSLVEPEHRRRDDRRQPRRRYIQLRTSDDRTAAQQDFGRLAQECQKALSDDRLTALAETLGVSTTSLKQLQAGWHSHYQAFSFPMSDGAGKIVGIRLRFESGKKLSIKGGKEGLFLPPPIKTAEPESLGEVLKQLPIRVLVTEGPSDLACILDVGFFGVGRASCSSSKPTIEYVRNEKPHEVVICTDNDDAGRVGAERLASKLLLFTPVRLISPPNGFNDFREWRNAGMSRGDVERQIAAADIRKLRISKRTN